jgi:hypothetical protein
MMSLAAILDRPPLRLVRVGACAGAELLGMASAADAFRTGALVDAQFGLSASAAQWLTYVLAVRAGGGEGLALGLLQGMVLKRRLPLLGFRSRLATTSASLQPFGGTHIIQSRYPHRHQQASWGRRASQSSRMRGSCCRP